MDILTGVLSNQSFPVVATIGFFDGVHKGHQYLLQQVTETARKPFPEIRRSITEERSSPAIILPWMRAKARSSGITRRILTAKAT